MCLAFDGIKRTKSSTEDDYASACQDVIPRKARSPRKHLRQLKASGRQPRCRLICSYLAAPASLAKVRGTRQRHADLTAIGKPHDKIIGGEGNINREWFDLDL
jgi:hypothetical protein